MPSLPSPPSRSGRAAYEHILRYGPRSRAELSVALDLSEATLTRVSRDLLESGLLRRLPPRRSSVGRPQEPMDVDEDHARFIGVKVTAREVYAEVTTPRAEPREDLAVPLTATDPATVLATTAELVRELASAHPRVAGVGISLAGQVREEQVLASGLLGWDRPVPFARQLREATGFPVALENDLYALTVGLQWFGIGRRYGSFVLVTVGAGVAIGVVQDGEVVTGASHLAGLTERFPTVLEVNGVARPVPLGEAAVTGPLLDRAVEAGAIRADGDADALRAAVAAGDPAAARVVRESAAAVGRVLGAAVALLDPDGLLLGGETADLLLTAEDALRAEVDAARSPRQAAPELRPLADDFDAWARGGAVIAIRRFVRGR